MKKTGLHRLEHVWYTSSALFTWLGNIEAGVELRRQAGFGEMFIHIYCILDRGELDLRSKTVCLSG